jgi:apolipoprotein N-acyltransferase
VKKLRNALLGFLFSFFIVALGQPARVGWLGAIAASVGFALFFASLPSFFSSRQRFLIGSAWFTAVQCVQLSWMTSIEFQGYYMLLVYFLLSCGMGCQFGFLTQVIPSTGRVPVRLLLNGAAFWTLMEWLRLYFLCGFTWNPIGLALTHFVPSMQLASVVGGYGLSFWVMLTNLAALNVWRSRFQLSYLAGGLCIAAFPYLFGLMHLGYYKQGENSALPSYHVAMVQTSLLPSEKIPIAGRINEFVPPVEQWNRILALLKSKGAASWDLIVLPEASVALQSDLMLYPLDWVKERLIAQYGSGIETQFPSLGYPFAQEREKVWFVSNLFWCQTLCNHYDAEMVVGLDHTDRETNQNYNSAFCLKPRENSVERYDKQILLPLAESLPFDFLKPISKIYGITEFFTPGTESGVFGERMFYSPSICYEETFPNIMRQGRLKGAQLFVNLTNDDFYPSSSLHKQHLFHARLRAVENGIPLVRSCNDGVSCAIDSFGRILGNQEKNGIFGEGIFNAHLNRFCYQPLFLIWGNAGIIFICVAICLVNFLLSNRRFEKGALI